MADYPASIYDPRTVENLPGIVYDAGSTKTLFAEDINNTNAEVVAIEETLGENPQGSYDTVAERLDDMSGGGGSITTPGVYYIETSGDDGTGEVDNPSKPFLTAQGAWDSWFATHDTTRSVCFQFGIGGVDTFGSISHTGGNVNFGGSICFRGRGRKVSNIGSITFVKPATPDPVDSGDGGAGVGRGVPSIFGNLDLTIGNFQMYTGDGGDTSDVAYGGNGAAPSDIKVFGLICSALQSFGGVGGSGLLGNGVAGTATTSYVEKTLTDSVICEQGDSVYGSFIIVDSFIQYPTFYDCTSWLGAFGTVTVSGTHTNNGTQLGYSPISY